MRRIVVIAGVLAALVGAAPAPGEPVAGDRDCLRNLRGIDLQDVTIPQLQEAMASGLITSVDLVDAYLARNQAYSAYNSVRELNPKAREQAAALDEDRRAGAVRGPLHGIPVLLKDNVGTDDLPTTAGSIAMEGQVPKRDAFITARLRKAGAIVLGKTNLSEWANWMATGMPNGYSSLGGQVVNAYNGGDPSGSSSGSGVAASLALAAATIGTETSGSILSPSLANSDVGLKTTRGMVSRMGIIPLAEGFDVPGPIVRNVTDAAAVMSAIAGTDPEDPATAEADAHLPPGGDFLAAVRPDALQGVRLAYDPSEGSGESWSQALDQLRALGATLVESDGFGNADTTGTVFELPAIFSQFHYGLDHYLQTEQRDGARVHSLAEVIAVGAQHPDRTKYGQDRLIASEAAPGVKEFGDLQAQLAIEQAHAAIDDTLDAADAVAFIAPNGSHIGIGAAAGHPTIVLPLGHPGGGRFAISFLGRRFSEADLIAAAGALETVADGRRPPTEDVGIAAPASCDAAALPPFTSGPAPAPPAGERATTPAPAPAGAAPTPAAIRLAIGRLTARRVRISVTGGAARTLVVRVVDARGRTLLRGAAAELTGARRIKLTARRALRPGRVRVIVTARDTAGALLRATAARRLRRS